MKRECSFILVLVLILFSFSVVSAISSGELLKNANFSQISGSNYTNWTNPTNISSTGKYKTFFKGAYEGLSFVHACDDLVEKNGNQECPTIVSLGQDIKNDTIFSTDVSKITSYVYGCYISACTNKDGFEMKISFENSTHSVLKTSTTGPIYGNCDLPKSIYTLCVPRCTTDNRENANVPVFKLVNSPNLPAGIDHVNFKIISYNAPYKFLTGILSDRFDTNIYFNNCSFVATLSGVTAPPAPVAGKYSSYWTNLIFNDTPISSSQVGDTVFAMVRGTNSTTTLNYSLYTANSYTGSQSVQPFTIGSRVNISYLSYVLSPSVVTNYSFNASSSFTSNKSLNITISPTLDDSAPMAVLDFPLEGERYTTSTPIWFNQSSFDEDDFLNLTWNFGDGQTIVIENYSAFEKNYNSSLGNVQHNYTNPGNYTITLTASEKTRTLNLPVVVKTKIFIVKPGVNVFPVITSPSNDQSTGSRLVLFNASQTYVLNCSNNIIDPVFTTNDSLKCNYLHAPGTLKGNLVGYNLLFNWTLDEANGVYKVGNWASESYSGNNGVVEFYHKYPISGRHSVKLKVTYTK